MVDLKKSLWRTGLKNEYIIYSAHYDHVGIGEADESGDDIYNGARDNAVGTTTVLRKMFSMIVRESKRTRQMATNFL